MNIQTHIEASSFSPSSRVWIYQSNQVIPEEAISTISNELQQFAQKWVSHNRDLKASSAVLNQHFLILMVDESQAGASGCSIDKSVYFIQDLAKRFDLELFDRMCFAYVENDQVVTVNSDEFGERYKAGKINDETLVFNNLIKTKAELESAWLVPLSSSWHAQFV